MSAKYTEEGLKELSSQLRCPHGERGISLANKMAETNTGMLVESLKYLSVEPQQNILEIGHGSCPHLPHILSQAESLRYTGLDISPLMKQQAEYINKEQVANKQAEFVTYDGKNIPFLKNTFDRIITINTLYFFEDPKEIFAQIAQILKPKGVLVITFQKKSFISSLAFTKYGFNLYEIEEVESMLKEAGLIPTDVVLNSEKVISKLGEEVQREYYIVSCKLNSCRK